MEKKPDMWSAMKSQWRDSINLILGLWLIASPWVFGFAHTRIFEWNAYACGVIIAVSAAAAIANFAEWEEWLDAALGIWLVVSPWVLGMTMMSAMMLNFVIVGLIVACMALWTEISIHKGAAPTA
ncbi:SPW repeat protein [Aestuariispira ectoiniformans]|uniref:SPW repeat protein n=1 Tax=Aestuariispira ectoiniformans TaxID=2775080 RepID=UPI00223AEB5B|nr:SPW repeat protein [Aestuariispira ectoiniformans]